MRPSNIDPTGKRAATAFAILGVEILVALGVAGLVGSSIGAPGSSLALEHFRVPEARQGDRGIYAAVDYSEGVRAFGLEEGNASAFAFQWLEDSAIYDSERQHHWTHRLVVTDRRFGDDGTAHDRNMVYHYDRGTLEPVAESFAWDWTGGGTNGMFGSSSSGEWEVTATVLRSLGPDMEVPCGLRNPLQGPGLAVDAEWALPQGCARPWNGLPLTAGPVRIAFRSAFELRGVTYVDYRATPMPGQSEIHLSSLRFREDLPYPILLTFAGKDDRRDDPPRLALALTHFEQGSAPLSPPGPMMDPLPAPTLGTPPIWGLDETGFEHPYPLSSAWVDARDDPLDARLRDFLEEHPDAFVRSASYHETTWDSGIERRWTIDVHGGGRSLLVCPTTSRSSAAPVLPVPAAGAAFLSESRCDWSTTWNGPQPYEPERRPTSAWLARVYDRMAEAVGWAGASSHAPGFGASFLTRMPDEPGPGPFGVTYDGDEPVTDLVVGRDVTRYEDVEAARGAIDGVKPYEVSSDLLLLSEDHRPLALISSQQMYEAQRALLGPSSSTSAAGGDALTLASETITGWDVPPAWTVGAIGFVAAFLAFIYWVFPWLRNVVLAAFFTRVDRDQALQNEARATVAAAIDAQPGIHFREIRRRTGVANGALQHHLLILEKNGLIRSKRAPGSTHYWPQRGPGGSDVAATSALRSEAARHILAAVVAHPDEGPARLAERVGGSRQSVQYHVKRLAGLGLLDVRRRGGAVSIRATQTGRSFAGGAS